MGDKSLPLRQLNLQGCKHKEALLTCSTYDISTWCSQKEMPLYCIYQADFQRKAIPTTFVLLSGCETEGAMFSAWVSLKLLGQEQSFWQKLHMHFFFLPCQRKTQKHKLPSTISGVAESHPTSKEKITAFWIIIFQMYYLALVRVTSCYSLLLFFQWCLQYSSVSSVNFINTLFDYLEGSNLKLCYIKPDTNSLFLQHPTTHLPLISVPYYLSWPVSSPSARARTVFVWYTIFRWKFLSHWALVS